MPLPMPMSGTQAGQIWRFSGHAQNPEEMSEWLIVKQPSLLEQLDSSAASFLRCQSIVRDSGLIGKECFDLRVDAHCFDHSKRCML